MSFKASEVVSCSCLNLCGNSSGQPCIMLQKDGLVWWFLLSVYFIMLQLIVQWSFCMERALWEFFMFLTRKSRLVFTFCNFLLLFTEEPEMNRWWTTVRWTSRWTRSSFWHLHWPRICHFICQAERSVSWSGHLRPLSLSHKHTHTLLYFITVTPQPGLLCFRALNLWWHHFSDIIASFERKVN